MRKSKLIDELIASVVANSEPVKDVRVGVTWTAVDGKYCGLSKTYGLPVTEGNFTENRGDLIGREAADLAEFAHSWNLVEAGIGCASIISMVKPPENCLDMNAREIILQRSPGKKVVMVGAFPFLEKIRKVAGEFIVLELNQSMVDISRGILPATACEYCIPDCDVLVITGSALVNKSLEHLLELGRKNRAYTILLGPSTVMSEVLFDYGVDVLAGTVVNNPGSLMKKLSQSAWELEHGTAGSDITFKIMTKSGL